MPSPDRRSLLKRGAVAAGLTLAVATTSTAASCSTSDEAEPAPPTTPAPGGEAPTFVLVGGSAAPSFYWMPLVRELSLRGHRSHAVELPAHGLDAGFPPAYQAPQDTEAFFEAPSPAAGLTLDDYATAVADVVRTVSEHGPVVLVGHSQGGPVITRAADRVADLLDHLVYVSAIAVTPAGSALATFAAPENAGSLAATIPPQGGDPTATGITRSNLRTADAAWLSAYKAAVMHDVPDEQFLAAITFLQQTDESVLPTLEDLAPDPTRWGAVPRTFVRLTADRWHTTELQDRMVSEADELTPDNPFTVRDLDSSHAGFVVTRVPEAADLLVGAASTGGTP